MINYNRDDHWLTLLFRFRGSLIPHLFPELVAAAIVGFLAALVEKMGLRLVSGSESFLNGKVYTILIIPLGFLLIFRSNISYGRYWDGRIYVGEMVKGVREITRNVASYHEGEDDEAITQRAEMRRLVNMLYELMALHLLYPPGKRNMNNIRMMKSEERKELASMSTRVPVVAQRLSTLVQKEQLAGRFTTTTLLLIDNKIQAMVQAWMDADRIVKTPLPLPYVQMLNALLFIYIYTVPFSFSNHYGFFTPLPAMLIALALLGINRVANEIENPFGTDDNDLPLQRFGQHVEKDSISILKERDPLTTTYTDEWSKGQLVADKDGLDTTIMEEFGTDIILSSRNFPQLPQTEGSVLTTVRKGLMMA